MTISLCLSDLPKGKIRLAKNGKKYITLCAAKRKEPSPYGDTHTVFVFQSKEERDRNDPVIFVGYGREAAPR